MAEYKPKILCFSCNFGWGYLAGKDRIASSIKSWVPVACSGKVDAVHILNAYRGGADGVLILGCPEDKCHFQDGNYQTRKKVLLLRRTLEAFGIEPERLKMVLSVDPEGKTIPDMIVKMEADIRALGPLTIRKAAMMK